LGLPAALRQIAKQICPHCNRQYGDIDGKKGHSKKQFMKCLYTANYNLYNVVIELNELKAKQPLEIPEKIIVDEVGNVEMTGSVKVTDNCGGKDDE